MKRFICAAILAVLVIMPSVAHAAAVNEHANTAAALAAVEDHWSLAELTGDTAYLENLLDARYRTVSAAGKVSGKAGVLANALKFSKKPSMLQLYRRNGALYGSEYEISSTTGVVIHYIVAKGLVHGITGVDVFSYDARSGWRALYSQHTLVR